MADVGTGKSTLTFDETLTISEALEAVNSYQNAVEAIRDLLVARTLLLKDQALGAALSAQALYAHQAATEGLDRMGECLTEHRKAFEGAEIKD